jgi:signal transduction histidine kinase
VSAGASGTRQRALVSDELPREVGAGPARTPLAQLLHALNQPLTGLQCSLEVTLASPRTNDQYVKNLRDGLALTERMRTLVEAVREMVEIGETQIAAPGISDGKIAWGAELWGLLREVSEELKPVADAEQVNIEVNIPDTFPAALSAAEARRSNVAQGIFRLLESALALASRGTLLRIDALPAANDGGFCVQWETAGEETRSALSRPEIGLLMAQAQLERSGAAWERQTAGRGERVSVRLNK